MDCIIRARVCHIVLDNDEKHLPQSEARSLPNLDSPESGLIGTVERGPALASALKDSAAVLLRAHGDAVAGANLEQAILRTIQLAFVGKLAHMAVAHGEPLYMSEEELAAFSAEPAFLTRPWEYYLSRVRERRSP